MHEKIAAIQNAFWKAYKDFQNTKDMAQDNRNIEKIIEQYQNRQALFAILKQLEFAWAPILNAIKEWSAYKKKRGKT